MTDQTRSLTAAMRADLVYSVADLIQERYLDEPLATQMADHLRQWFEQNVNDLTADPDLLAQEMSRLLFSFSRDQHIRLTYRPDDAKDSLDNRLQQHFQQMQGMNYGVIKVERLAGNIGLLELHELPPVDLAGDLIQAAMDLLVHMHSLIIDLRLAPGGAADMVQLLVSYLVGEPPQPISGVEWPRLNRRIELQTLDDVPGRRFADGDVFILTSGMTHSAAEALVYDLRALKRVTVVGERTRGGAHLTAIIALGHGLTLHLPEGRAINPITGSNWEKSGIVPDIAAPPEIALRIAHQHALEQLLNAAAEPDDRRYFQWELESLKTITQPVSVNPRLMAGYGGSYGQWQITIGDGGLYARRLTTLKLIPISDTTFMVSDSTRLRFITNETGAVVMMQVIERDGSLTSIPRDG